ncbi:MAG: adenylyl-sulfate kinase [Alphaproteobacteria bacterium]|uniref:Adenylyl-sulfate kinase n=1 Tax=Candidatus Nitrobium versatile TaxID=2884831 RepID=A0A953JER6_9BACT|nr:adenylyl-sulfate kinase [Candidatus Nitrobium versatile]
MSNNEFTVETKATNVTWHRPAVSRQEKEKLLSQRGILLWFTGLSASGKSTIAHALEHELYRAGYLTAVLDGDNIRHGLNKDLGFSPREREENIRRIGEVGKLFIENGIITMTAFISPFRSDRDKVRASLGEGNFIEIYVKCPIEELRRRDPKGLYKKALAGEVKEFTGISSPYEEPLSPEITLDTYVNSPGECVQALLRLLREWRVLNRYTSAGETGTVAA